MSRRYSIAQARAALPSIVDQAEAGQEIELTRRGKPVAAVISARELARLRGGAASFGGAYRAFLERHALAEVGLDEDFASSVRDAGAGRRVRL